MCRSLHMRLPACSGRLSLDIFGMSLVYCFAVLPTIAVGAGLNVRREAKVGGVLQADSLPLKKLQDEGSMGAALLAESNGTNRTKDGIALVGENNTNKTGDIDLNSKTISATNDTHWFFAMDDDAEWNSELLEDEDDDFYAMHSEREGDYSGLGLASAPSEDCVNETQAYVGTKPNSLFTKHLAKNEDGSQRAMNCGDKFMKGFRMDKDATWHFCCCRFDDDGLTDHSTDNTVYSPEGPMESEYGTLHDLFPIMEGGIECALRPVGERNEGGGGRAIWYQKLVLNDATGKIYWEATCADVVRRDDAEKPYHVSPEWVELKSIGTVRPAPSSMVNVMYLFHEEDEVLCGFSQALLGWSFHRREKDWMDPDTNIRWPVETGYFMKKCVGIGATPPLPPPDTCEWAGDPHFKTFDGSQVDTTGGTLNVYWIVMSDLLEIQGYFQGKNQETPMLTRGLVVAGRVFGGNKLIIKHDNHWFKDEAVQFRNCGSSGGDYECPWVVEWNHTAVMSGPNWGIFSFLELDIKFEEVADGMDIMLFKGLAADGKPLVSATTIPKMVEIAVTSHPYYQNNVITVPSFEGMDGQCGKPHDPSDDSRGRMQYATWSVPNNPKNGDLFKKGVNSNTPLGGNNGECTGNDLLEAESECKAVFGPGSPSQLVYYEMCVIDRCEDKLAANNGNEDAGAGAEKRNRESWMTGQLYYVHENTVQFATSGGGPWEIPYSLAEREIRDKKRKERQEERGENDFTLVKSAMVVDEVHIGMREQYLKEKMAPVGGPHWQEEDSGSSSMPCGIARSIAKITNTNDMKNAVDAGVEANLPDETLLYIAADCRRCPNDAEECNERTWRWFDGSDVCGFSPWDADTFYAQVCDPDGPGLFLCMDAETGRWDGCSGVMEQYTVCTTDKLYKRGSEVDAFAARGSCGYAKQLAMPKSAGENRKLALALDAAGQEENKKVWFGGAGISRNDRGELNTGCGANGCTTWMWDDDTPMCSINKWSGGTSPNVQVDATGNFEDLFACGWHAGGDFVWAGCTDKDTPRYIICELRTLLRQCPYTERAPDTLGAGPDDAMIGPQMSNYPIERQVLYKDACMYIAKGEWSCTKTCLDAVGGFCDIKGIYTTAASMMACKLTIASFGGMVFNGVEDNWDNTLSAGCAFVDNGDGNVGAALFSDGDMSPRCDAVVDRFHHRICACDKPTAENKGRFELPSNYMLLHGEKVRLYFPSFESGANCQITLRESQTIAMTLQFISDGNGGGKVARSHTNATGAYHAEVLSWPIPAEGEWWLDIALTLDAIHMDAWFDDFWQIFVNGEHIQDLDYPRAEGARHATDVSTTGCPYTYAVGVPVEDEAGAPLEDDFYIQKLEAEISGPGFPVSMMGENCVEHTFEYQSTGILTWNFRMMMTDITETRCVRCESKLWELGRHLSTANGMFVMQFPGGTGAEEPGCRLMDIEGEDGGEVAAFPYQVVPNEEHHYTVVLNTPQHALDLYKQGAIISRLQFYVTNEVFCNPQRYGEGYVGCYVGKEKKQDANAYIYKLQMTPDKPTYYEPAETCEQFTCRGPMQKHVPNYQEVTCSTLFCSGEEVSLWGGATTRKDEDNDLCCADLPTCAEEYPCSEKSMVPRWDAEDVYCTNFNCIPQDEYACCVHRMPCSEWVCSGNKVLKEQASTILCLTDQCQEADEPECCESLAQCSSLAENDGCPSGMAARPNSELWYCHGRECDADHDAETCCAEAEKCLLYPCHSISEVHVQSADILFCKTEDGDPGSNGADCSGPQPHCCGPEGMCALLTCPDKKVLNVNARTMPCSGAQCGPDDIDECCEDCAMCDTKDCPEGWSRKEPAAELPCENVECFPDTTDKTNCCRENEKCTNYRCVTGTELHPNHAVMPCLGLECMGDDPPTPWAECCLVEAMCTEVECPYGHAHIAEANTTRCDRIDCDRQDEMICCKQVQNCEEHECPQYHVWVPGVEEFWCKEAECTAEDDATCCALCARCGGEPGMECPSNYILYDDAANMYCPGITCAQGFQDCCTIPGQCSASSFECPWDYIHKGELDMGFDAWCEGEKCENPRDTDKCCYERVACSTMTTIPETGWVARDGLDSILCKTNVCSFENDIVTCAKQAGFCEMYPCPDGMSHRHNARDLMCATEHCDGDDPHRCCGTAGFCHTYHCPSGYIHRWHAEWIECSATPDATECSDLDKDICCHEVATCETWEEVPAGYTLKPEANEIKCQNLTCTLQDLDACTVQAGRCSSMKCPGTELLRMDASDKLCDDSTCDETSDSTCCLPVNNCATYRCPEDKVLHMNADQITCEGFSCEKEDEQDCCVGRPTCEEFTFRVMGHHLIPNAKDEKCAGAWCTVEDDLETCTELKGTCTVFTNGCPVGMYLRVDASDILCADDYCESQDINVCCGPDNVCSAVACPDGMVQVWNAEDVPCGGFRCQDTDIPRCCDAVQMCDAMEETSGYVHKQMAETIHCQNKTCTREDLDTCMDMEGRCTTYICPTPGYQLRNDASDILCADKECSAEHEAQNTARCCAEDGYCNTYHCPSGWVPKENQATIPCRDWLCRDNPDKTLCCHEQSWCTDHTCRPGMQKRDDADWIKCFGAQCGPDDDEVCCAMEGRCSIMDCDYGTALRYDAADIFCDDKDCSETRNSKCCAPEKTCPTYTCPSGWVPNPLAEEWECYHLKCTDIDRPTCCLPVARCSSMPEFVGFVLKKDHAWIKCASSTCDEMDVDTCMHVAGTCPAYECDEDMKQRHDSFDTICVDEACESQANRDLCCAPVGRCDGWHCPEHYVMKENPHTLHCSDATWDCTEADRDTCCDPKAKCDTFEPDTSRGLVAKFHAPDIDCAGAQCTIVDTHTCTTPAGSCNTMECVGEYAHRADADQILCSDPTCTDSDFHACCAKTGRCITYQCPSGWVHAWHASVVDCHGFRCDDDDREICCVPLARCNSFDCPTGYTELAEAPTIKCLNSTCTHLDIDTCCGMEGRCSSMTCDQGQTLRANAPDIFCASQICTGTDKVKCCAESHSCATLTCPSGWVPHPNAENRRCAGYRCHIEDDRDECCEQVDRCGSGTLALPTGFAWKPLSDTIKCIDATCTEENDHDICFNMEGRCSMFACNTPEFTPRPDANDIWCSSPACDGSDDDMCCAPSGSCASFLCNSGYIQKQGSEGIPCFGHRCMPYEHDLCCEEVAKCSTMNCDVGYVLKDGNAEIKCLDHQCSRLDLDICCALEGRCTKMQCSPGYQLRNYADELLCSTAECGDEDEAICCAQSGKCMTLICPSGWVPNREAGEEACQNYICLVDYDLETCCNRLATCNSFPAENHVGRAARDDAASIKCLSDECSDEDIDICTVPEGTCAVMDCNPGDLLRHDANEILCLDPDCDATPLERCCAPANKCITLPCPDKFMHKPGPPYPTDVECSGFKCDIAQDLEICCQHVAMCDTFPDRSGYVKKMLAERIPCSNITCPETDLDTCMDLIGRCTLMDCPAGMELRNDASDIFCADERCAETDADLCCAHAASCLTYSCPDMFNLRPEVWSKHEKCHPDTEKALFGTGVIANQCNDLLSGTTAAGGCMIDTIDCKTKDVCNCFQLCKDTTNCSTFVLRAEGCQLCTAGKDAYTNTSADHTISTTYLMSDVTADLTEKCGACEGSTVQCQSGWTCTDADRDLCCQAPMLCSDYSCAAHTGYTQRPDAHKIECKERDCTMDECCSQIGRCTAMVCPAGTIMRQDAAEKYCAEMSCINTVESSRCCADEGHCRSFHCPSGYAHKPNADDLTCDGYKCFYYDVPKCCQPVATCNTMPEPTGFVRKALPETIKCKTGECTEKDDHDTCLDRAGTCATAQCPDGQVLRQDAADISCLDYKGCTAVDHNTCCVDEGKCSSLICPETHVLIPEAATEDCRFQICTEGDWDICCVKRAYCNTLNPPTGWCKKAYPVPAELIMCKTQECSNGNDLTTCADQEGRCITMHCMDHLIHREGASDLLCDDPLCEATPEEKCCVEPGNCASYDCPDGYVKKPGSEAQLCATWKCTEADREECCEEVDVCMGSMLCPWDMVPKLNALTANCHATQCGEEDIDTCCTFLGQCSAYDCPANTAHKANAEELKCLTMDCDSQLWEHCCAEDSLCSTFMCPSGFKLKETDEPGFNQHCSQDPCQDTDRDVCCKAVSRCNEMSCPDGWTQKNMAADITCADNPCEQTVDLETCCEQNGMCSQFQCDTGRTLIADASTTPCEDEACTINEDKCCAPLGTCATFTCASGSVRVDNAEEEECEGWMCIDDDKATCCEPVALCTQFPFDDVPTGWQISMWAPDIKCAGKHCSAADDKDTCLVQDGRCTSCECPEGFSLRFDAADIICNDEFCDSETDYNLCCRMSKSCAAYICPSGMSNDPDMLEETCTGWECSDADADKCCTQSAFCNAYSPTAGYSLRGDAQERRCANISCSIADKDTCSAPNGRCATFPDCEPGTKLREDAHEILCSDSACADTDPTRCCAYTGMCSSLVCPEGYTPLKNNHNTSCLGWMCEIEVDKLTCCEEKAKCNTHTCPAGDTRVDNAEGVHCAGNECDPGDDKTCCIRQGSCLNYDCPYTMTHRHDASERLCDDVSCVSSDDNICCVLKGMCSSYACPEGYIHQPSPDTKECQGFLCGSPEDLGLCCQHVAKCTHMTCGDGWVWKPDYDQRFCESTECTMVDREECCNQEGYCTMKVCTPGMKHRENAAETQCIDVDCATTEEAKCCAEEGNCLTYACPSGWIHKHNAEDIFCSNGWECSVSDRADCCKEVATCNNYVCDPPLELRGDAQYRHCFGENCEEEDEANCCVTAGTCASVPCPAGELHRPDPEEIMCQKADCADQDTTVCCSEIGKCGTYRCPEFYYYVDNYRNESCSGFKCIDADRDKCCQPVAKCNTMSGWAQLDENKRVLKANAIYLPCSGNPCVYERDVETCTHPKGVCSLMDCPAGEILKSTAATIPCDDEDCSEITPTEKCCTPRGRCAAHTCKEIHVLKGDARNIDCGGKTCDEPDDEDICCNLRANCGSHDCLTNYTQKAGAAEILCVNHTCTLQDEETCCAEEGMCPLYDCPADFLLRPDASTLRCKDRTCEGTDFNICCAEVGKCSSMVCPTGYQQKDNASEVPCSTWDCPPEDLGKCCDALAMCHSALCPAGQTLRVDSDQYCRGKICVAADLPTCCVEAGHCLSQKCPEGMIHRHDASDKYCSDPDCSASDFTTCCAEEGYCASVHCPAGRVTDPGAGHLRCQGFLCTEADWPTCCVDLARCSSTIHCSDGEHNVKHASAPSLFCKSKECTAQDNEVCCASQGKCPQFKCPQGTVFKDGYEDMYCADESCAGEEWEACCVNEGECGMMACPHGYAFVDNYKDVRCEAHVCTEAQDLENCCYKLANCDEYICPYGFSHKPGHNNSHCAKDKCDIDDLHTCCAEDGMCSSKPCTLGYVHRHNAREIPCDDVTCEETNINICCAEEGKCASLACPDGYARVDNEDTQPCASWKCDIAVDKGECCIELAKCSSHSGECPDGTVPRLDASEIFCAAATCTADDDDACCIAGESCVQYVCPTDYESKPNAEELLCADEGCSPDADFHHCCIAEGSCGTFTCPSDKITRVNAGQLPCLGHTCGDVDIETCCKDKAYCNSYTCPYGYSILPTAETTLCADVECDQDDVAACCGKDGYCSSYECPHSATLKHDANEIQCTDKECTPETGTDWERCCVENGKCATLDCGKGKIHIPDANTEDCSEDTCTDNDIGLCCNDLQRCNALGGQCGEGFTLKHGAENMFCADIACKVEDDKEECCAPEGSCATYPCPEGELHKHNAAEIFCLDELCQMAENTHCCDAQDSCSTFQCPSGYLHKYEADQLSCPGLRCIDSDRDHCCDRNEYCDSWFCPYHWVFKLGHELIMCANHTCGMKDLHRCCVEEASCGAFPHCPDSYALKHNASAIYCDNRDCNTTAFETCCDHEHKCNTLKCPEGKVSVGGNQNQDCHGWHCTLKHDEFTCCRERAPCSTHFCGPGLTRHLEAEHILCKGTACTVEDDGTCCVTSGTCGSMPCPAGYDHIVDNFDAACSNPALGDPECNFQDYGLCCAEHNMCHTFECPEGYTLKATADTLQCVGWKCVDSDYIKCCEEVSLCHTLECRLGTVHAADKFLAGCTATPCTQAADNDFCCMEGTTCTMMNCPHGFGNKPNSKMILCDEADCEATPTEKCCDPKEKCTDYTCRANTIKIENPETIHCKNLECGAEDAEVCCEPCMSCADFNCDSAQYLVLKVGADSIFCKTKQCQESDTMTCCEKQANCWNFACGLKKVAKDDAHNIYCAASHCDPSADADTCCDDRAYCTGYGCGAGYVIKENADSVMCAGAQCSRADKLSCCDEQQACSVGYTCPAGFADKAPLPGEPPPTCPGKQCKIPDDISYCCESQNLAEGSGNENEESENNEPEEPEEPEEPAAEESEDEDYVQAGARHQSVFFPLTHVLLAALSIAWLAN